MDASGLEPDSPCRVAFPVKLRALVLVYSQPSTLGEGITVSAAPTVRTH